ncbi:hypothetical protein ABB02_00536 [Clostridiaceae bacterium JG1575]|nr:hypothetical protein ABB02_00536 [Clostridiaceae bacterium JG1575]
MIRVMTPESFVQTTWSGGTTEEILIDPKGSRYSDRQFLFRISTAVVDEASSEFTKLPGYRRYLMPLSGPLTLFVSGQEVTLAPFEVAAFDGGAATFSQGAAHLRDLNLMVRATAQGNMVFWAQEAVHLDRGERMVFVILQVDAKGHFLEIDRVLDKPKEDELILSLAEDQRGVLLVVPKEEREAETIDLAGGPTVEEALRQQLIF